MKTINLAQLAGNTGRVIKNRTLDEIDEDIRATRDAFNPYTVLALNILSKIKAKYLFPFLQPNVINPLEIKDGQNYYMHTKSGLQKAKIEDPFGMKKAAGIELCIDEKGFPYFISENELSTEIGSLDYRVHDLTTLREFISKLTKDMSFLHPMHKDALKRSHEAQMESQGGSVHYKQGDIVFIPGQKYYRLGIVESVAQKEYLAHLFTPDDFVYEYSGVNLEELLLLKDSRRLKKTYPEFYNEITGKNIYWSDEFKSGLGRPASIGSGAVLMGYSNYSGKENDELGFVVISGFDTECAIVRPLPFEGMGKNGYGEFRELAIPTQELVYISSIDAIKKNDPAYENCFASDLEILGLIGGITQQVLDQPDTKGLITLFELTRFQRIHQQISVCPEIKPEYVSGEFIRLLTKYGISGIEWLAKISNTDFIELSKELLSYTLREASMDGDNSDYCEFVPTLNKIVREETKFNSIEGLLRFASPKINLYQIVRDGGYTLGYIGGIEKGVSEKPDCEDYLKMAIYNATKGNHGLDNYINYLLNEIKELGTGYKPESKKEREGKLLAQVKFLKSLDISNIESPFHDFYSLPEQNRIFDEDGKADKLLSVMYSILTKKNPVKWGRDQNDVMTYPDASYIDERFILYNIGSEHERQFLNRVMKRINEKVNFDGKERFFQRYGEIQINEKEDGVHTWAYDDNRKWDHSIELIKPLYDAVCQLSRDSHIREQIVAGVIGDKPLLLENFYDYQFLTQLIHIRGRFWRDQPNDGKNQYLSTYGWPRSVGNSFGTEFYSALANIDFYHRGFPLEEPMNITREHRFRIEEEISFSPSLVADRLLEGIAKQTKLICAGYKVNEVKGLLE